jgi:hypothetical protein
MNILHISKHEFLHQFKKLYPFHWMFPKADVPKESECAYALYRKLKRMKHLGGDLMKITHATAKYSQQYMLDKPYWLMRVIYEMCKSGMGDVPDHVYEMTEQYLIKFLNERIAKEGLDFQYHNPYSQESRQS